MRAVLIVVALLLVAVSATAVVFDAEPFRPHLSQVTLALAILGFDRGVLAVAREGAPAIAPAESAHPTAGTASSAPSRR